MAKKNKKPKMVMVISVKPPGGKAPKKPTETADVDTTEKAARCGTVGVKKALNQCPQCGGPAGPRGCRRRCSFGPAERFVLQGSNNLNQHQRDMLREG